LALLTPLILALVILGWTLIAAAVLTAPLLHAPLLRATATILPRLQADSQRRVAGCAAATVVVLALLSPVLLLLIDAVGSPIALFDLTIGYPGLLANDPQRAADLTASLGASVEIRSAVLRLLFAGTGAIGHLLLGLVTLAFCYAEGPNLARRLLSYTPLDLSQRERLIDRHRRMVLRILHDSAASALTLGISLAIYAVSIDHLLGRGHLPLIPLMTIATVLALLPLLGPTTIWLPLAALEWSWGQHTAAIAIGAGGIIIGLTISHLRRRLGARIHEHSALLSFTLFMAVVGGLTSFGLSGVLIGPLAVIVVAALGEGYRQERDQPPTNDPSADAAS
jgi:predicted PurR-regulated permease PerM